jgi:hypothetical protein
MKQFILFGLLALFLLRTQESFSQTISTDHINEYTTSHGVVVDKRLGINTGATTITDDLMVYPLSGYYTVMSLNNNGVRCFLAAYSNTKGYAGTSSNHPFEFYTNNTKRLEFTAAGLINFAGPVNITSTTKTAGYFYSGTTDPTNTNRLNFDGNLYATTFYASGSNSTNWNTAFGWGNWAINFGTISGTICQGDDSRLSNARVASDVYSWAKSSTKPSYSVGEVSGAAPIESPTFTGTPLLNYSTGNYFGFKRADGSTVGTIGISSGGDGFMFKMGEGGSFIDFSTNTVTNAVRLIDNGNVGIGTTNPQNKLDVNGTVHAKEFKASLDGWSDYVFEKEYKLLSLNEVENYIKMNNRLPEVPSTEEVIKDGVNLGEMNALLLKKVEELTLYVIELNKKIEKLESAKNIKE